MQDIDFNVLNEVDNPDEELHLAALSTSGSIPPPITSIDMDSNNETNLSQGLIRRKQCDNCGLEGIPEERVHKSGFLCCAKTQREYVWFVSFHFLFSFYQLHSSSIK